MILENFSPLIAFRVPPVSPEMAMARVSEYSSSDTGMCSLSEVVFKDMEQLLTALRDCGYRIPYPVTTIDKSPMAVATLYSIEVIAKDEKIWKIYILVEIEQLRIILVSLHKKDIKAFVAQFEQPATTE